MSDAPAPRYERFDDESGFQKAVDLLLGQDGRELRLFDPDLSRLRFASPARIELIERFLQASRTRRLYIALHDTDFLTKYCPRMMALLARHSHAVQINRTQEEARKAQDSFLVLDALHYVRRPSAQFFRGALGLNDENEALAMRGRFGEIWAASSVAVAPTTLGL